MPGLITDRTQRNVYRRKELAAKGWANMTSEERMEWSGDPFSTPGANLFATGTYYPSGIELEYKGDEIIATAVWSGVYLFAISIIGRASNFANRILTLSAEGFVAPAKIEIFWHDDNGYDYAGGTLLNPGSATFNTGLFPNVAADAAMRLKFGSYRSASVSGISTCRYAESRSVGEPLH